MMNWSIEWYRPGRMSPAEVADQVALLFFDGALLPRSGEAAQT